MAKKSGEKTGGFKPVEKCKEIPVPHTGGYPTTGVEDTGIERRGNGAQTKATKMRGPVA